MVLICLVAACSLLIGWLILLGRSLPAIFRTYAKKLDQDALKKSLIVEPFKRLMERWRIFEQFSLPLGILHTQQMILEGADWSYDETKALTAKYAGAGYLACMCSVWLSVITAEALLLVIGLVLAVVLAIKPYIDAKSKVVKRKNQIILALPDMLSRLQLLVGAGENLQRAFIKIAFSSQRSAHSAQACTSEALVKEWRLAAQALQNGQSFSNALERFNRNCAVQEVSIFTTVLLLNYKRGGDQLVLALRELSYSLWERRKSIARMRGEEASSKLVFPLVGILLILIVLIAAPAIMIM
ncbi:type II secretion system F family protein [Paenibacillus sp. GXUN7292]|uniref:type II secretion system F family protein n=1 Tax=Paenibacillus sp. GXUN7292 TaxID=3422499 RepID=UPI003D7D38F4